MKFKIQDLGLKLNRKNIFLLSILVIFLISLFWLISTSFFVQSKSSDSSDQDLFENPQEDSIIARVPNQVPLTPYIIPVGTQMIIPPWIMQQYQLSEQQAIYENALNFLIYNYGVAAPSVSHEGQDTYYIPLSVYSGGDDYDSYVESDYRRNTVMVDVTSLAVDDTPTVLDGPVEPPVESPEPAVESPEPAVISPVSPPPVQEPSVPQPPPQPVQPKPPAGSVVEPPVPPADEKPPAPDVKPPVPDERPPAQPVDTASPEQAPSAEDSTTKPEIVLITTKPVNTVETPPVSEPVAEPDLSATYPATCDKAEEETEASAPCSHCVGLNEDDTEDFLNTVSATVQNINRKKNFPSIVTSFCKNCYGVNVNDFFQYIEERAKSEKVPPAIMFAFILRESNGNCNAGGDRYKSFGLFQLNVTNSTRLKPCESNELSGLNPQQMKDVCVKGEYRGEGYPEMKGRCLNNPYCNFEEAFHLLKGEKWGIANGNTPKPIETDWVEMEDTERNLWRDAIIAYNGAGYLKSAEERMKNRGLYSYLDNWEVKRMFFVKSYLYNKSKHEQCGESEKHCYTECEKTGDKEKCNEECKERGEHCRARYNPQKIIHNLAYVERITGRETRRGLVNSSMCQWIQFRKNNSQLSCR